MKSTEFIKPLKEDAGAGVSCAGSIATVVKELGGNTKQIIKRQQGYTNQRTPGGIIKGVKQSKAK